MAQNLMNIKLFQCKAILSANTLNITILAMDEEQAKELALKCFDKETRADIESGLVKFITEEFEIKPCVISTSHTAN